MQLYYFHISIHVPVKGTTFFSRGFHRFSLQPELRIKLSDRLPNGF